MFWKPCLKQSRSASVIRHLFDQWLMVKQLTWKSEERSVVRKWASGGFFSNSLIHHLFFPNYPNNYLCDLIKFTDYSNSREICRKKASFPKVSAKSWNSLLRLSLNEYHLSPSWKNFLHYHFIDIFWTFLCDLRSKRNFLKVCWLNFLEILHVCMSINLHFLIQSPNSLLHSFGHTWFGFGHAQWNDRANGVNNIRGSNNFLMGLIFFSEEFASSWVSVSLIGLVSDICDI